jgi:hypothetical protein
VRVQLDEARHELSQCRAILGDATELPPDTAKLVQQLRTREEEARTLRLQVDQHAQVNTFLYKRHP